MAVKEIIIDGFHHNGQINDEMIVKFTKRQLNIRLNKDSYSGTTISVVRDFLVLTIENPYEDEAVFEYLFRFDDLKRAYDALL